MLWRTSLNVKPCLSKSDDEEFIGFFEGYATTADIDLDGDRFAEEALAKNTEQLVGKPVLLHHGRDRTLGDTAVGRVVEARYENGKGLWIRAGVYRVFENIWRMVKNGLLNALSVGGLIKRIRFGDRIRVIEDAEITEVSLTQRGVNPRARVSLVFGKSFEAVQGPRALAADVEAVVKGCAAVLDTPYFSRLRRRLDSQRLKRAAAGEVHD
ncbi:MAG: HK97 family phage prohead protease [Candidatus Caldarchaeum sp.]|nr:HK97 family phage prohead protease [Candidatus Caldarchaeum sp.]MDW7977345.1 HK97 family phage prohead protease [Candidatus Caldarchaeum sp.]